MRFNIESIDYQIGEEEIDLALKIHEFNRTYIRTGISKVYESQKLTYDLGILATEKALSTSNIKKNDLKFLIYVTQSSTNILPGDSVLIHKKLELSSGMALYDINAGCSGFTQAMLLAVQLVNVLGAGVIICADKYRAKLDPADRSTNAVFSDAASAVIIAPGNDLELIDQSFETETSNGPEYLIQLEKNGYLKMNGPALWEYTRGKVVRQINSLIEKNQKLKIEINRLYIHQASKLVVDGVSSNIHDKKIIIPENYKKYGNTVSSTIPILMKEDIEIIKRNTSVIAGFGVGVMSACLLIKGLRK